MSDLKRRALGAFPPNGETTVKKIQQIIWGFYGLFLVLFIMVMFDVDEYLLYRALLKSPVEATLESNDHFIIVVQIFVFGGLGAFFAHVLDRTIREVIEEKVEREVGAATSPMSQNFRAAVAMAVHEELKKRAKP